jgi:CheY-like chemotaxis protein
MIVDTLVNVFVEPGEVAGAVTKSEQAAKLQGARILLTEDNDINQQIAVELLEGAGATVKVANNGREAVEILSNGPQPPPFDLVLMDLQMPEMDGYQATAKLRADPRFSSLPIIAMTAHATIEERQNCLAAGMNDHISKPIDPDNLFETVGRFYKPSEAASALVNRSAGFSPLQPAMQENSGNSSSPQATAESKRPEGRAPQADDLPSIIGLDTEDGLTRVAGNRKLYLKLLRQFIEQQGPALGQIAAALATGDMALAERHAHTLKGVAGNIGARQVQTAAGALEKIIHAKAAAGEMDSAWQQAVAALDPLIAHLKVVLHASAPETRTQAAASAPMNPAQSREAMAQLSGLLEEFDPAAVDFIEANHLTLRPLFAGDAWQQFEKLVQGYSFAEAQTQLEQALKILPSPENRISTRASREMKEL